MPTTQLPTAAGKALRSYDDFDAVALAELIHAAWAEDFDVPAGALRARALGTVLVRQSPSDRQRRRLVHL